MWRRGNKHFESFADRLWRELADLPQLEARARRLAELLALALQSSPLVRPAPPEMAEAGLRFASGCGAGLVFRDAPRRHRFRCHNRTLTLTDASGGILKSFRSSDRKGTAGIEYGQEWYRAIMQKLDDASDVVALLTTHSVNRPWILYEAGVAKGKLSANDRVLRFREDSTLLLNIRHCISWGTVLKNRFLRNTFKVITK